MTKDRIIPVTDEELREIPLPTAKAIEIHAFVPLDSIDPIKIGDGYYLQPDGQVAAKPYTLLRKALERSSKAAVAKYAWSGRERLCLLRVRNDGRSRSAQHVQGGDDRQDAHRCRAFGLLVIAPVLRSFSPALRPYGGPRSTQRRPRSGVQGQTV